jgi:hypothetical protein
VKHADFHIGLEFMGDAGFRWRCTDIGTRTILAIQLDRTHADWYQGPPYIAKEVVFDEREIEHCHLTQEEAIMAAVREHQTSGHPGFPSEFVQRMMKGQRGQPYPHAGVLRFERCRTDGELLHPYAGRKKEGVWMVDLYLPFPQTYDTMAESDFIALPIATAYDIRVRAERRSM